MDLLRITKEFTFDMAHALHGYNGKCANIHGHTYHLAVTVTGKPLADEKDPNAGMVMDFSSLKNIVNEEVIKVFDHALVLKNTDPLGRGMEKGYRNVIKTSYQPTCEKLLLDFVTRIGRHFTAPLALHSVMLRETATSYASWHAEDNR